MQTAKPVNVDKINTLLHSIEKLYSKKRIKEARKKATQLLSSSWLTSISFYTVGVAALNADDLETAIKLFKHADSLKSLEIRIKIDLLRCLASAYLGQQDYDNALSTCSRLKELAPRNFTADLLAGVIEKSRENFDIALAHFKTAKEMQTDSVEAILNYGETLIALERKDEAIDHYLSSISLVEKPERIHFAIGKQLQTCDNKASLKHLRAALYSNPSNRSYAQQYSKSIFLTKNIKIFDQFINFDEDLLFLLNCDHVRLSSLSSAIIYSIKSKSAYLSIAERVLVSVSNNSPLSLDLSETITPLADPVFFNGHGKNPSLRSGSRKTNRTCPTIYSIGNYTRNRNRCVSTISPKIYISSYINCMLHE